MAEYHLVFNMDRNYLFYFYVTAHSIAQALQPSADDEQDSIVFNLLIDDSVDLEKADLYQRCFEKANADSSVNFSFKYHRVDDSCFESVFPMTHGSVQSFGAYYRLLFADYLPEDVTRVLYLDIDLYINADIRQMFKDFPMQDQVCYISSEPFYLGSAVNTHVNPPIISRDPYDLDQEPVKFNVSDGLQSGVMLINVEQWRKQNIKQQCLDVIHSHRLILHDQDALSYVLRGKVSYLPWCWNMSQGMFWMILFGGCSFQKVFFTLESWPINGKPKDKALLKEYCDSPKIYHFAGEFKPWCLNRALPKEKQFMYQNTLIYMQKWLMLYSELAQLVKKQEVA